MSPCYVAFGCDWLLLALDCQRTWKRAVGSSELFARGWLDRLKVNAPGARIYRCDLPWPTTAWQSDWAQPDWTIDWCRARRLETARWFCVGERGWLRSWSGQMNSIGSAWQRLLGCKSCSSKSWSSLLSSNWQSGRLTYPTHLSFFCLATLGWIFWSSAPICCTSLDSSANFVGLISCACICSGK